jgi:hypothetical protein
MGAGNRANVYLGEGSHPLNPMKPFCISILLFSITLTVYSQSDETEFPAGLSHSIEFGIGAQDVWQYKNTRPYFNSLQYSANFTLPGNWFRVAPMVGIIYPGHELNFLLGLKTSYRIHTGDFSDLGSLYNIHLTAEAWYTQDSFLVGGGLGTEVGQLVIVSFRNMYHTDHKQVWSMLSLGVMLYPRKARNANSPHYHPEP